LNNMLPNNPRRNNNGNLIFNSSLQFKEI
jgi:hypothetical protein